MVIVELNATRKTNEENEAMERENICPLHVTCESGRPTYKRITAKFASCARIMSNYNYKFRQNLEVVLTMTVNKTVWFCGSAF